MKTYLAVATATIAAGVVGFSFGRLSVPPPPKPKPIGLDFSESQTVRFGRYDKADRIPGSADAINWLEAEHKAGRVVGQHGSKFEDQFRLARLIGIGSCGVEIELLSMDRPDGHYAKLTIDPKTGIVIDAKFGDYCY